jgi:hypothetical protein
MAGTTTKKATDKAVAAKAPKAGAAGAKDEVKEPGATPGAAAPAPGAGAPPGGSGPEGGDGSGGGDADPAAELKRLTDAAAADAAAMALAEDEARAYDALRTEGLAAWDDAIHEDGERNDAKAWDLAIAEDAQRAQTPAKNTDSGAVPFTGWVLPEIADFPATVTLTNNTRDRFAVAGPNVAIPAYGTVAVEVDQVQWAKLSKALTSSARAHKWNNLLGLQVMYDSKD